MVMLRSTFHFPKNSQKKNKCSSFDSVRTGPEHTPMTLCDLLSIIIIQHQILDFFFLVSLSLSPLHISYSFMRLLIGGYVLVVYPHSQQLSDRTNGDLWLFSFHINWKVSVFVLCCQSNIYRTHSKQQTILLVSNPFPGIFYVRQKKPLKQF